MRYSLEELNNLNSEELNRVIQADADGEAELGFDLEAELLSILHNELFAGSETFGDLDEETQPEKAVRVLVESLDFRATLGAINALQDELYGNDGDTDKNEE